MLGEEKKRSSRVYDGVKDVKLGTEGNPAVVTVKTKERMKEVAATFEKNGWKYEINIDPDKAENITALKRLLNPPKPKTVKTKVGRNDPCPCGSGKKYKKCHGK
jgi:SWIM/SEC-C metal-binding protein